MKTLLAAPFVGEIGWELLSWQGRVRWTFRNGGFDRLVVLGAPGKAAFYADMPLDYRPVDLAPLPGMAYEDRRIRTDARQPVDAEAIRDALRPIVDAARAELSAHDNPVEILWPTYTGQLWPCDPSAQEFIRFEPASHHSRRSETVCAFPEGGQDAYPPSARLPSGGPTDVHASSRPHVLLVQRTRQFRARDNWPAEVWAELAERLRARGIHAGIYPHEAEAAIAALSACDLAVGQSTGGLHLAALCGCPAVVWGRPDSYRASPWEMTDRQRYQTLWNPLGTPVDFHGLTSQPAPAEVAGWISRALNTIGRRTGTRAARAAFHRGWALRQWLDARVVRRPSFRRWPWPVQKFVRYSMV